MTLNPSPADRIQRAEIFTETWTGVVQKLQQLYSRQSQVAPIDIQVVPSANPDNFEAEMQQKSMKFTLPVIVASPTNVDPNDNSYNRHMLRRHGMPMQIDKGREWWTVIKASPTIITFQVMLVTDDMLTMLRMAERWMNNETWGFVLKFENFDINIQVIPDKNLGIPQRLPSSGGAEQYRLVTNLKVATYAGYAWMVPAIRAVEIESLFPHGTIADALEQGVTDATVAMSVKIVGPKPPAEGTPEFKPGF